MRILVVLFVSLVFSSASVFGDQVRFVSKDKKSKEHYKYSKCVEGATYFRQKLSYDEVCKYGSRCPKQDSKTKVRMYCMHKNISECFEKKAWKTENELVGLSSSIDIALLTQGLSYAKEASPNKTCAYYD